MRVRHHQPLHQRLHWFHHLEQSTVLIGRSTKHNINQSFLLQNFSSQPSTLLRGPVVRSTTKKDPAPPIFRTAAFKAFPLSSKLLQKTAEGCVYFFIPHTTGPYSPTPVHTALLCWSVQGQESGVSPRGFHMIGFRELQSGDDVEKAEYAFYWECPQLGDVRKLDVFSTFHGADADIRSNRNHDYYLN